MDAINVFFTVNDSYAKYLSVAIASILFNTKEKIKFYIINDDMSLKNKLKLQKLKKIRNFEIEYLKIDIGLFSKFPTALCPHVANQTNARFLVSSLKPNLDKVIFIDADLVLDGDIKRLWDVDIKDYYMAAAKDQASSIGFGAVNKLPLKEGYTYVNTGVTVFNLSKWRENNVEEKLFEAVEKFKDIMAFPDQDALNVVLQDKVKLLPLGFNIFIEYMNKEDEQAAYSDVYILHYAGDKKPWDLENVKNGEYFWKYAKMSPYYNELKNDLEEKIRIRKGIPTINNKFRIF